MRKDYTTPQLLVHGSIEDLTLTPGRGKGYEGNDGCAIGEGGQGGGWDGEPCS